MKRGLNSSKSLLCMLKNWAIFGCMLICCRYSSVRSPEKLTATHSAVLSPFDPVVWDRKRAEQLFDFSYRLECYIPAPKRQYGYFVLPLLHRGQLVGRMDAKMHRQTGILEVISLWLQEGIKPTTTLQKGYVRRLLISLTGSRQRG